MLLVKLLVFMLTFIWIQSEVKANTIGQLLDQKLQNIEEDIDALQLLHGNCAPCNTVPGTRLYCDCRNLEPKKDCLDFYRSGVKLNGLYKIPGPSFHPLHVYCDQSSHGGGWTVIQRRKDGSENFFRNWNDYKLGFGDLKGEFWFGNDNIHNLTGNQPNYSSLLINMKLTDSSKSVWVRYSNFSVGNESSKYTLHVQGFSGSTTDQITSHNNVKFSTYDQDNDHRSGNCARSYKGGWWYHSCYRSNLNGLYLFGSNCRYVNWGGGNCSVQARFSEMKVRRNV